LRRQSDFSRFGLFPWYSTVTIEITEKATAIQDNGTANPDRGAGLGARYVSSLDAEKLDADLRL